MPQKARILIVEDEPLNARILEFQLTRLGYSIVAVVASGEEAVKLATTGRPDIVLMDVQLEGAMDGVEAATLIRRCMGIPVVYLTGNSDEQTMERARATDAFAYLHKPFQEGDVHSTLQMALDRAEMEERLVDEHRWFAATLRSITDGVIATDATGGVKVLNPAAEQLTGWNEEEALGRDLSEVFQTFDPETRQPAECVLKRLLHGETAADSKTHCLLLSRTGTETAIEHTATCIATDSEDMRGVLVAFSERRGAV
ncbi:MAG: response regulator [Acidobacteriaceae bacterium]|nr:response regulator [Acidobacteriaceae bacterium]MBV9498158.1 response regulator [Acidobacteriaceae bacterium]